MNNKMIASLEEWDNILNYYRPNGSSKTWYLEELKQVNPPLMWGNWNIFRENGEMFDDFKHTVISHNLDKVFDFVTIDDIKNKNHLYIISVYHPIFFQKNRDIGFKCISEKYKNDIRNGKSKIVILYIYEGYAGMVGNEDFEIIEEWRIKENFPSKSVYCITGNLIGNEIAKNKKLDLEVFGVSYFDKLNSNIIPDSISVFEPENDNCLFLSYNREPRKHRILLAYEMIRKNLINKGLFSLNKPSDDVIRSFSNNPKIDFSIINEIANTTPFKIDDEHNLNFNLACNISLSDYRKTFISLVTETITVNDTLFLSEKIWKPIIVGHPFIVYGNPNTLKYLKSIGYKTFNKWVDESYDSENDEDKRRDMIVNEIYKLQKFSLDQLKEIRQEMTEVCEFNKNHYIELLKNNWIDDLNNSLVEKLKNIWNTFNKKEEVNMKERRYLPTLSELVDRLSICQLKEVFITDHKEEYAQEIQDIIHDINISLEESDAKLDADTIRSIVVLSQMNLHIWHNESNYRNGIRNGNNLELTHGLNGIRNVAKNKLQEIVGGRKDYKIDCLAAEFKDWEISWTIDNMEKEITNNKKRSLI